MDTKWKKCKVGAGFLSFALGVSLVLSSLLPIAGNLFSENGRDRLGSALQSDFQETEAFRSYLSEMMNRFIAMGAGGPLNGYYYDYYDVYAEDTFLIEKEATAVIQQDDVWYFDGYPISDYQPTESDRERWKKEAEAWNKVIQEDRNLLYSISQNGKVLYSNTEDISQYPAQGYGFLLSFDGSKCSAIKNGSPVDLYGDGVYQEDGQHWYLPGYSNFRADEEARGVTVSIAVADEPALYIKGSYSSQGNQWRCNRLYYLEKNWRERRQNLVVYGALETGIGLCLLAVWFLLRKEKPLADRAIAQVTGHLWFEVKLLLLLGALCIVLLPLTEEMRYLVQEVTYAVSWEVETAYYQYPWFLSAYLYEILRQPVMVLLVFWSGWLFVNDLRYGDKPWRHGICGMLTARGLKLPIQRRLSRLAGLMALTAVGLCAVTLNLLVYYLSFGSLRLDVVWLFLLPPSLLLIATVLYSARLRRLWGDLGSLTEQIRAVKDGSLTSSLPLPEDGDLRRSMEELGDIQQGMARAVEEQTRSERMKVELVTNVSHDIKTPLTSIISYAELLKQEKLEPPAGEYVDILAQKAERLRTMVLDVFEVSKAASGELPVKLEELDLAKLLRQTTADMAQAIEAAPVTLRQSLPEEPVTIVADGDRLYRVFQNLLQNALKYALEGSRVYLALTAKDGVAEVAVKNTSRTELPDGVDFTARFVRGDQSRTDGGSGLGLAIADSFTRACGGELFVEPVADLFVVRVTFPLSRNEPEVRAD